MHLKLNEKEQLPALTGLRFVAALSVVVAHGSSLMLRIHGKEHGPVFWLGPMAGFGMSLFFVLSGFVIHYNYNATVARPGFTGVLNFFWARFARLYPLFILVLVIDVVLGSDLYNFLSGNPSRFEDAVKALPYYVLLAQSWIYAPSADKSLIYEIGRNVPLTWSISTEWFFYFIYPIVGIALLRIRKAWLVVVAALVWCIVWATFAAALFDRISVFDAWGIKHFGAIAGIANGFQDSFVRWLLYFSPYLRLGEFMLGCMIAQAYLMMRDRPVSQNERRVGDALLLIGLASTFVITYLMYSPNVPNTLVRKLQYNFALAPSVALIIFCAARYRSAFANLMSSRCFNVLGEASYSIYLIHMLVFFAAASNAPQDLSPTAINAIIVSVQFLLALAIIILLSIGLHGVFEAPARRWLRGLGANGNAVTRTLVAVAPLVVASWLIFFSPLSLFLGDSVSSGIRIVFATYGENCGTSLGNASRSVTRVCNGLAQCDYIVDVVNLGDPAPRCPKSFSVEYQCAPDTRHIRVEIPPEAGFRSRLSLACSNEPQKTTSSAN